MTATTTLEKAPEDVAEAATQVEGSRGTRHTTVVTGLGELTLVAEGDALVGVYFPGHQPAPDPTGFGETVDAEDAVLSVAAEQLVDYVTGRRDGFDVPVRPTGSERARQVWELIAAVPRGETTTYAALGRAVGVGPRAAGQFVARNPLSVVVPCHRVVASDGRLTGYAGGVERKRRLLEVEGVALRSDTAVARAAATLSGSQPETSDAEEEGVAAAGAPVDR